MSCIEGKGGSRGAAGWRVRWACVAAIGGIAAPAFAAPPSIDWAVRYDGQVGDGNDQPAALAVDVEGNTYVTGNQRVLGESFATNLRVAKYDSAGNEVWARVYDHPGAPGYEVGRAVELDADGNVYVVGTSIDDMVTLKYDRSGVLQWAALHDVAVDAGADVAVDGSGNVYAVGSAEVGVWPDTKVSQVLVKYDADGHELWSATETPAGDADTRPVFLELDAAGHAYVAAQTRQPGFVLERVLTKYSPGGVALWQDVESDGGLNAVTDLRVDPAGNAFILGDTSLRSDMRTTKLNAQGQRVWSQLFSLSEASADQSVGLDVDAAGNVYVTGYCYVDHFSRDAIEVTLKYAAADGTRLWAREADGPEVEYNFADDILVDAQGNVYVHGHLDGDVDVDFNLRKYDTHGNELWFLESDLPYNTVAFTRRSMGLDGEGNVLLLETTTERGPDVDRQWGLIKVAEEPEVETEVRVTLDWLTSYFAEVTVTNHTSENLDWQVAIPVDGDVIAVSGARYSFEDGVLTAEGTFFNNVLRPGRSVTFTFQATRGDLQSAYPHLTITPTTRELFSLLSRRVEVTVTNPTQTPVIFHAPVQESAANLWVVGAEVESQDGDVTTFVGDRFNEVLQPGETYRFTYTAPR